MKSLVFRAHPPLNSRSRLKVPAWIGVLTLGVVLLGPIRVANAQADNFNDGNDNGWTHLDLNTGTGGLLPGAIYSFPDDGLGGKAYEIRANAPPVPDAGPARAFSYLAPSYNRFSVAVDAINWATNVDQAFGLLVRASNIGLGSTDGYVMNYNVADGNLQINTVASESPTTIAQSHLPMMPLGGPYRWVFTGYGDNFLGRVFVLPDLNNPIGSVVATDGFVPSGQLGLFVFNRSDPVDYTNPNSYADATFDNYDASAPAAGSLRATVVELLPSPKGQVLTPPLVQAAILDQETAVQPESIRLWVDGAEISSNSLTLVLEVIVPNNPVSFPGVTVSYQATSLSGGQTHTNRLVYSDSQGSRTNEWTFIAPAAAAIVLQSTATLAPANFQPETGATVDTANKRITVPQSGNQRFYRLSASSPLIITSTTVTGNNVVMTYQ
jgi:hypothetical protein